MARGTQQLGNHPQHKPFVSLYHDTEDSTSSCPYQRAETCRPVSRHPSLQHARPRTTLDGLRELSGCMCPSRPSKPCRTTSMSILPADVLHLQATSCLEKPCPALLCHATRSESSRTQTDGSLSDQRIVQTSQATDATCTGNVISYLSNRRPCDLPAE